MMTATSGDTTGQRYRHEQVIWWLLAVLFTVLCAVAPLLMKGKAGSVVWIVGMMACGATLGGLSHHRPWRWGALLSAAFLVEAIIVGGASTMSDVIEKVRFGVTLAIPAFIGTYGGAFVRKLVKHRIHLTGDPESIRFWKAAVAFGVAAGVLSLAVGSPGDVPVPAMLLLLSASTAITYLKPQRLWRWVVAMAPGLPAAVVLRIIVEISRSPSSHDLYPLEIGIALIYAVVPVLAGAILGRIVRTGSITQPPAESPTYG